jgi:adenylate cyclase, class 2
MPMTYEVELKFPLANSSDVDSVRERIDALGAKPIDTVMQRDVYFAHPARDFAQTDEAFRLRCVGEQNALTYKGPLLDAVTKTRREIEVSVASGLDGANQIVEMLTLLGFRSVRDVLKRRTPFHLAWQGREWELALDEVHELGCFLELETLATEVDRDSARESLLALSRELRLGKSERRSYLRLLLERDPSVSA